MKNALPPWLASAFPLILAACPAPFDPADSADSSASSSSSTESDAATSSAVGTSSDDGSGSSDTTGGAACPPVDGASCDPSCERIGIAECDAYLEAYGRCIDEHLPEAAKLQTIIAVCQSVEAWRQAAEGPEADTLADTCANAICTAQRATEALECEWPDMYLTDCPAPEGGSCKGLCGSDMEVPDGDGVCYCDATCEEAKDCCLDYYDHCAAAEQAFDAALGADVDTPAVSTEPLSLAAAVRVRPSLAAYPTVSMTLLAALQTEDPVRQLGGLRDSFAPAKWKTLRDWDRFGAIEPNLGFVTLEGRLRPTGGTSIGCMGGFVEAVRVLEAPDLSLSTVVEGPVGCPLARTPGPCLDPDHTGLHALVNVAAALGGHASLRLAYPTSASDLRQTFADSKEPYFVSASHVSRRDERRRFHHMLVVIADEDAHVGPLVFDVTGYRGVALRTLTWAELWQYVGGTLASSDVDRYRARSVALAVLHGDPTDFERPGP